MSLLDVIYDGFSRPDTKSPSGKPYVTPRWLEWQSKLGMESSRFMFFNMQIRRFLIVVCWIFLLVGILPPFRGLMAIGIPFLIFMHIQNRRCWKSTGYVAVSADKFPTKVVADKEFQVEFVVSNFGPNIVPSVIVQVSFGGDTREFQYQLIQKLRPKHRQKLVFTFKADKGWGDFYLGPVHITVRDELGLYVKTVEEDIGGTIKAEPENKDLVTKIKVEKANMALHSGNFEMAVPGRSVSFYGLRPWVDGDTINAIDWKRSLRLGELVVKDFERFSATDATIVFDRSHHGHSEFESVSTFRVMIEAVVAVFQCLTRQQIRTQIRAQDFQVPYGSSTTFFTEASGLLAEIPPMDCGPFVDQLPFHLHDLPNKSLLFLVTTTANLNFSELLNTLVQLDDRQVELVTILIDSAGYGRKVSEMASLNLHGDLLSLGRILTEYSQRGHRLNSLISQFAERTYFLGPDRPLTHAYDHITGM